MRKLFTLVAVLTVTMAPALVVGGDDVDARIRSAIEHDLWDEKIGGIDVDVADGTVTLTGTVDNVWEKTRASDIASGHNEIAAVVNRVEVGIDRSDQEIANDVAQKLRNYVHYTIFDDVNVEVLNGNVTLTGKVTWGYKAQEMERMAMRIPGVRTVENEIDLLPNSTNDEQIRAALASRIYGDSVFFNYAIDPTPPVHIVVENGRVTLTGVVDSKLQQRRAEILARQTFGVFSVDNQLRLKGAAST